MKVAGSLLSEEYTDEGWLRAEDDRIGEKHRDGLLEIEKVRGEKGNQPLSSDEYDEFLNSEQKRKKIVEIVTDSPGSFTRKQQGKSGGGADGLMSGVMGWEYLLGEMFGADHVAIGVDGMCLTQDCIGGTGAPAGLGDVFFRR